MARFCRLAPFVCNVYNAIIGVNEYEEAKIMPLTRVTLIAIKSALIAGRSAVQDCAAVQTAWSAPGVTKVEDHLTIG